MMFRPNSVRVRLTFWYTVALAFIILVFAAGVLVFAQAGWVRQIDQALDKDFASLERVVLEEPDEIDEMEEFGAVIFFEVTEGGSLLHRTARWKKAGLGRALSHAPPTGSWSWRSPEGQPYRVKKATVSTPFGLYSVAVAQSEALLRQSFKTLGLTLILGFPGALALAVIGGYFLAGRLLSPVGAMAEKARHITAERLSDRLPVGNAEDEFGRLATVFNDTLARLDDSFARLRQFTADASHELRTPLTAIRSVGEVALQDKRDTAQYREVVGSMLEEADRLAGLVDSLLALTRADSGSVQLSRDPVDLAGLAREVLDYLRVLAEEKGQILRANLEEAMVVSADRGTLRQALVNVVDNAIKYSPEGATISVALTRVSKGEVAIEVKDSGPGIAPEHHRSIFERFYRVDKERSREMGGAGLGLAIAQWSVEANGGRIDLESIPGEGSTFRIVLTALGV